MNNISKEAIVLAVKNRYFAYYRKKRITTAWGISGAKFFDVLEKKQIEYAENVLIKKGYKPRRMLVKIEYTIVPN